MSDTGSERFARRDAALDLEEGSVFAPAFDTAGLLPAIVTSADDGEVLMFAWMNAEALALTLDTKLAHFWSRSRKRIWKKGEESGNTMRVVEMRTDCDQDVLLVRVAMGGDGRACHTGRRSCFYRGLSLAAADSPVALRPVEGI
jgi:phosphoribosyl-AMP cyclohydrolase